MCPLLTIEGVVGDVTLDRNTGRQVTPGPGSISLNIWQKKYSERIWSLSFSPDKFLLLHRQPGSLAGTDMLFDTWSMNPDLGNTSESVKAPEWCASTLLEAMEDILGLATVYGQTGEVGAIPGRGPVHKKAFSRAESLQHWSLTIPYLIHVFVLFLRETLSFLPGTRKCLVIW